jgi:hypothetical protein
MTWRRRIASIVLLAAVVLVGGRLLTARDTLVPVQVTYRLPAAATRVEVEVRAAGGEGEPLARFMAQASGGEAVHETRLPPGDHEARVTVADAAGRGASATRRFHAERDARVTIDLTSLELR